MRFTFKISKLFCWVFYRCLSHAIYELQLKYNQKKNKFPKNGTQTSERLIDDNLNITMGI